MQPQTTCEVVIIFFKPRAKNLKRAFVMSLNHTLPRHTPQTKTRSLIAQTAAQVRASNISRNASATKLTLGKRIKAVASPNLLPRDASPYHQRRGHDARRRLLRSAVQAFRGRWEVGIAVEAAALGQGLRDFVLLDKRLLRY